MISDFFFSSRSSASRVDYAGLVLRFIGGGSVLYAHGYGKFQKLFSEETIMFVNPFGIGESATFTIVMIAEFICAALVIIGLFTRVATIPLIINMAFIFFVIHKTDDFATKELPFLYLSIWIAIFLLGPGKHSLDRLINKKKSTV